MKYATKVLAVAADGCGSAQAYELAVACLRAGELVALPTETVYGLAANAADEAAVNGVFSAKARPADNPLIVHVRDVDHAREFCDGQDARLGLLAQAFWPGPLTAVVMAKPRYWETVGHGLKTIGLRVPAHPVARRVIAESGLGLAAPSANLSGRPSPTSADHVLADLNGRIPLILDGGPCRVGIESTVVDLSSDQVRILRPGQIDEAALSEVLGQPVQRAKLAMDAMLSPGTRYRHYQPDGEVWVIDPSVTSAAWLRMVAMMQASNLAWGYAGWRDLPPDFDRPHIQLNAAPEAFAHGFYRALRALDAHKVAMILIDAPIASGMGLALWDRLTRAANERLVDERALAVLLQRKNSPETTC